MPYKNPEDRRAAVRRHYQSHKQDYAAKNARMKERIRFIIRDAKNTPCTDCGIKYPFYVMQFDHILGDKKYNISDMTSLGSVKAVAAEIEKCEVVCANCHAERTYIRLSNGGSSADFESVANVGSIPAPDATPL